MAEELKEDWLDTRLRDDAAYIDDAGFTARVVQKLPARSVRYSVRAAILLGLTVIASVIVYLLSGGGWFIAEGMSRIAQLPLPMIWLGAAVAGLLLMAGGLFAALSSADGRSR